MKMSKYQARWIGFKVVRGNGTVGPRLRKLGFFKTSAMGFNYALPCGLDAGSPLARIREMGIKGVANVFLDANWMRGQMTAKQAATNYAD